MEEAEDLAEIMTDSDGDKAMLVARLDASASLRPEETVELAVDLRKLHFFDLESGATIGA
jgi:multiple sugar transport system ATP-binding protein